MVRKVKGKRALFTHGKAGKVRKGHGNLQGNLNGQGKWHFYTVGQGKDFGRISNF